MAESRELLDHFYVCCNKMDGLYYLAARHLGLKENTLALLYTLNDGQPRSQKQLAQELLIPKTKKCFSPSTRQRSGQWRAHCRSFLRNL